MKTVTTNVDYPLRFPGEGGFLAKQRFVPSVHEPITSSCATQPNPMCTLRRATELCHTGHTHYKSRHETTITSPSLCRKGFVHSRPIKGGFNNSSMGEHGLSVSYLALDLALAQARPPGSKSTCYDTYLAGKHAAT